MLGGLERWPNLRLSMNECSSGTSVRNVLRFEGLLESEPAG